MDEFYVCYISVEMVNDNQRNELVFEETSVHSALYMKVLVISLLFRGDDYHFSNLIERNFPNENFLVCKDHMCYFIY